MRRDPGTPFAEPEEKTEELIRTLVEKSSKVLVKKLANNDRQWAIWNESKNKWWSNQSGPLLPAEARTSGFFPPLQPDPDKPHNRSTSVEVYWPTTGKVYSSRFIWYSAKSNAENQFTINPPGEFCNLSPASFLMIFAPKSRGGLYRAVTVDAEDDLLLEYISDVFKLDANFRFNVYKSSSLNLHPSRSALQQVVVDLVKALEKSPAAFEAYMKTLKRRTMEQISHEAYEQWKSETGFDSLNPFCLACPGDAIYELTRVREFSLYRAEEAKTYGAELVRALTRSSKTLSLSEAVASCVERFDLLYAVFMRASQARSKRAGGNFETHVKNALSAGGVPHSSQFVTDGYRPDFVLPNGAIFANKSKRKKLALILALKTTLRERWKQVVTESAGCPIFLGTLDESVPSKTLDKLKAHNIVLVVPERFKTSPYAEYEHRSDVVTFRTFFDNLKTRKSAMWLKEGIQCFGVKTET